MSHRSRNRSPFAGIWRASRHEEPDDTSVESSCRRGAGAARLVRAIAGRLLVLLGGVVPAIVQAQPPLVVETEPLSAEEQRGRFHLPAGFEIQLVASEPDIGQPMNMNFDARGRLWVTSSVEYPYPVAGEGVEPREERWGQPEERPARDWVTVLDGIDDAGKPASIQRFAEGLNIPIGVIPDGDGALIYSIPNIEHFRDIDGDGKADERTKLFGPFGNQDTHGMVNSFTRGLDGWIYACHGFRNTSKVQGTDGHVVEMNSGNTFRFQPDGSRIEHWTHGQVNPFGLCFDPWGNLYSADCHSKPLTCLLRGAYYPSFGKPHDGLGFGPDMIDHNHGSTGICGCAWYDAEQFPAEHDGCIFLCNPVTGRVHRDKIEFRGSSPWAVTQPDFITCDDGWFRPVDVKLGPDGALYIADFYNAIIGHYEVPLEHPRRDRTHGRIWRVVYRGEKGVESRELRVESPERKGHEGGGPQHCPAGFDLTRLSIDEQLDHLSSSNIATRYLASQQIAESHSLTDACESITNDLRAHQRGDAFRVHATWLFARAGELQSESADSALDKSSALVMTHAMRAMAEEPHWKPAYRDRTEVWCTPRPGGEAVCRAAIEAIGRHPYPSLFRPIFPFVGFPAVVTHRGDDLGFQHAVRLSLRNQLTIPENVEAVIRERIESGNGVEAWSMLANSSHDSGGVRMLLAALDRITNASVRETSLTNISRYGEPEQIRELVARLQSSQRGDLNSQLSELRSIQKGLQQRGDDRQDVLDDWGSHIAEELLDKPAVPQLGWTPVAYGPNSRTESAFGVQTRPFADGQQGALLHSSFPPGETGTGILRSDAFDLPAKLSFFIAGHNGLPSQPVTPRNLVRLCAVESGRVLFEAVPPRSDTAQRVEWDLAAYQGQRGYLEIVDGDDRNAYAWLAVGRFSLEGLNPSAESPQVEGCRLVAELKLADMAPRLVELVRSRETANNMRNAAAEALLALYPDARLAVLQTAVATMVVSDDLREQCYSLLANAMVEAGHVGAETNPSRPEQSRNIALLLKSIVQSAPAEGQRQLAMLLAGDRDGALSLLTLVEEGAASPRLLQDAAMVERLQTWNLDEFESRLAKLTADLPAADAAQAALLEQRRGQYRQMADRADAARGRAVFKQHCAACHQIGNEGAKIGPQLDGIGARGPDRLLEDILDPNRNVDAAFRTSVLVLTDGRVLTGLVRREEGATLVLADSQGKEFSVPTAEIDQRKDSSLSLMPAQLGEQVPAEDLVQLIEYLLTTRPAPAAGVPSRRKLP